LFSGIFSQELCGKGGVLRLAQSILSLTITPEFVGATVTIASTSRMKAKVLSIVSLLKFSNFFLYLLSATHTKVHVPAVAASV